MKNTLFNRQRIITIFILCCSFFSMYAQDPSAIIDLESTTQGMLAPRMTTAEREAIATPAQSLLVYDTDTESFWYYKGTDWTELGAGASSGGLMTYSGSASGAATGLADSINNTLPDVTSTITISGAGTIDAAADLVVCLNVTHTFAADLEITLTGPDGSTSVLMMDDNGGTGDNLTNTCFSDAANNQISGVGSGDAPFTGTWKPLNPLSAFVGQNIAGDWVLTINDDANGDHGRLVNWSINIGQGEPIIANIIQDGDGDTKIQVEEKFDEDIIRYDLAGSQRLVMALAPGGALRMLPNSNNTILGNNSGEDLSSGSYNTFLGAFAGKNVVDGSRNILIGEQAGLNYSGGSRSVAIGPWAGRSASGSYNVFLGSYAGLSESNSRRLHIHSSGSYTGSPLIYGEFDNRKLFFHGDVGIGTSTDNKDLAAGYRLSVKGKIACEEVLVDLEADWPDYVFESDYDLRSLAEVQTFIDEKGHLPGVPSAEEVKENGIEVGQMNKILMEKVEELTLYILEQNEMIQAQNARLEALENK